jgi:hypothetical protein
MSKRGKIAGQTSLEAVTKVATTGAYRHGSFPP